MTDSIAKYKAFNFSTNAEWQRYYDDLLPVPSYQQVEKFKRKWYKKNIDPSFDTDFTEAQASSSSSSSSSQSNDGAQEQQKPMPPPTPFKNKYLYAVETLLKLLVFVSSVVLPSIVTKIMIALVSVLGVIRNKGMVKFNKDYLALVVTSEFFHNIMFTLGMPHGRNSIVFYLPIYIHFLSGIVEYKSAHPDVFSALNSNAQINSLVNFVKANRNYLMTAKNKIEIYLFFYSIAGIFFGATSFINVFLMYQFLSIKDKMIQHMRQAQAEFKQSIVNVAPGPLKPIAHKFVSLYEKLINLLTPQQP